MSSASTTLAAQRAGAAEGFFTPRRKRLITTILLAAFCAIWVYPLLWMIAASFKPNAELFQGTGLVPESPTFDELLVRAWTEANMQRYFFNTLFVTVGSVRHHRDRDCTDGLRPRAAPAARKVRDFRPDVIHAVPAAGIHHRPGVRVADQLLGLGQSLWGLMLATCGHNIVIFTLLFAGYFTQMPKDLEEAARMDGVGPVKTFWYVMLPLSMPIIVTVVVMQTLQAWNDFLLPLVITLASPELRTLSVGIYSFKGENFVDWGGMTAASTIAIVPVILIFLFLQRYFVDGLAGAVKG